MKVTVHLKGRGGEELLTGETDVFSSNDHLCEQALDDTRNLGFWLKNWGWGREPISSGFTAGKPLLGPIFLPWSSCKFVSILHVAEKTKEV